MFNTYIKQNKQELLWIFTAALAFRVIWFLTVFFVNPEGFYFFDSQGYIELGRNILSRGEFGRLSEGYFYKEHFRTPGYPLIISLFLLIFQQMLPLVLFQVIIASATPLLVYLITLKLNFSKNAAIIAGVLMAVDFPSILFANAILSDTLFVFLLLLSVWLILLNTEKNNYINLALSALTIGFAVLIRPIGILLPILLVSFILIKVNQKALIKSLVFLTLSYLLIFSWVYRNHNIFGFKFLSTVSNVNFLHFRAAEVYADKNNITIEKAREYLEKKVIAEYKEIEVSDYRINLKNGFEISNRIAGEIITNNPFLFLKQSFKNGFLLLIKPARSYIDYQLGNKVQPLQLNVNSMAVQTSTLAIILTVFQGLILMITWLAFIVGLYILIKEKNFAVLIPLLLIILYFTIASSGPEADARLRMPLIPFAFIVASRALVKLENPRN